MGSIYVERRGKMNMGELPKVGIVTFPIFDSGITPLSNLIDIVRPISKDIHLITGGAGYTFFKENNQFNVYEIEHNAGTNAFTKVIKHLLVQLKYIPVLIKNSPNADVLIFFLGGEELLAPILIAKLLRKNVVLFFVGSGVKLRKARKDMLFKPLDFLVRTSCIFSDRIILYSRRLSKEYGLDEYGGKLLIAHEHFLDFTRLKVENRLSERDYLVGYIGRLCEEKGALQFVRAIPKVLERKNEVTFLVGGDGYLRGSIEKYINEKKLNHKVTVSGWIPKREISACLNRLKLLVLPSYTEGLPNIVLEAMACGTPVLATAVGCIPDIIREGATGFLMEGNSPECIAENVIRALNHPRLEDIADNARVFVQREFSYDVAVKSCQKMFKFV